MISRLPRWVWLGGFTLSFIAGMINAVGFLGFEHQAITHLTGTTTMLSMAVAHADLAGLLHLLAVILAFLAGAILSGFIIQDSTLRLGRRYGVALFIESLLLLAAVPLLWRKMYLGDYLASCACGLQNAMASMYSGAVIRTTHVTGMFTDLGILIGHFFRKMPVDFRRVSLYALIILGFLLGGLCSALLFPRWGFSVLYVPAAITMLSAGFYGSFRKH